jgi:hypothetical protein
MWNHILTTRQHAVMDYVWTAALPGIAHLMGWSRKATAVVDTAAGVAAVQTALTDFEGGVKGVIPMQCHLAGDAVLGIGLLSAAGMLRDAAPQERIGLAIAGLVAVGAAFLTNPIPRGQGRQHAQKTARQWRDRMGERVGQLAGAKPRRPSGGGGPSRNDRRNGSQASAAATRTG